MTIETRALLSEETYTALHLCYQEYERARAALVGTRNYLTPADMAQLPPALSHEELSALEAYEFVRDRPAHYFAYLDVERGVITTWAGQILGMIVSRGAAYRSNFGDKRRYYRVRGINGLLYGGWHFDAGDYIRLHALKEPVQA